MCLVFHVPLENIYSTVVLYVTCIILEEVCWCARRGRPPLCCKWMEMIHYFSAIFTYVGCSWITHLFHLFYYYCAWLPNELSLLFAHAARTTDHHPNGLSPLKKARLSSLAKYNNAAAAQRKMLKILPTRCRINSTTHRAVFFSCTQKNTQTKCVGRTARLLPIIIHWVWNSFFRDKEISGEKMGLDTSMQRVVN